MYSASARSIRHVWTSSKHPAPDGDAALRVIEEQPFGVLVTHGDDGFNETHLPFLLRRDDSAGGGTLDGHFARANRQWRDFASPRAAVAIFRGPHGYISPSWYEPRDKPYVPTWNYVAVHAHGVPRLIEDEEAAFDVVRRTVEQSERDRETGWSLEASHDYARQILPGIVAFTLSIDRLDAQFKLSQDKPPEIRARVVDALGDDPLGDAMRAI
jgi:transcriptional regulator